MNPDPKVLVYVPCHNYIEYAKECMDSIVNQSYPNQEVIVSFNECTDGTDQFVRENYPQVKIIEYTPFRESGNPGINDALKMSDCDIYVQCMMDDKLEPNFWEQVLPYFTSPEIGFVRIGIYQFSETNPEGAWWKPFPFNNPLEILMKNLVFVCSPTRKEVAKSVGGHDVDMFIFGDWDFWMKAIVLQGWKWTTCDKPLYWLRRHSKASSSTYDSKIDGEAYTALRDRWLPVLKKFSIIHTVMATPEMIRGARDFDPDEFLRRGIF